MVPLLLVLTGLGRTDPGALDEAASRAVDPSVTLALLVRSAEGHGAFGAALLESCVPPSLTDVQAEMYQGYLEDMREDQLKERGRLLRVAARLVLESQQPWVESDGIWLRASLAWEDRELTLATALRKADSVPEIMLSSSRAS